MNPSRYQRSRRVAITGVCVALSFVFSFFSLRLGFAGGSISFQMIPLIVLARLEGAATGVIGGMIFGFLYTMQEPFVYHIIQFLLDYPLAFGALGLAGLPPTGRLGDITGVLLACTGRYLCHLLSGVIFIQLFTSHVPSSPFIYSALYNASYMLPSTILTIAAVPPLMARLENTFPPANTSAR